MSYVNIAINDSNSIDGSEGKRIQLSQPSQWNRCKDCARCTKSIGIVSVKCLLSLLVLYVAGVICYYLGKVVDSFCPLSDRFGILPEHDYNGIARYTVGGMLFLVLVYAALFLCVRVLLAVSACVKSCVRLCFTSSAATTSTSSEVELGN